MRVTDKYTFQIKKNVVKLRRIEFRVTKNEYERFINIAQAKGFSTVAAYLRSIALGNDLFTETKIAEIHQMVKEILERNAPSGKNPKR